MRNLTLYWNTLRHLKAVQIYGRARRAIIHPRVGSGPLPAARQSCGNWTRPAERRQSMLGPTLFEFLNEQADLNQVGWDDPALGKLWRYNLHYFDDLNATGSDSRAAWHRALIERWLIENPVGTGTGWEPYPTSLRVVNWIKWALAGGTLSKSAQASLAMQTRWLAARLETHLLGNHLFVNAKALIFAGLFFEGDEPARWLTRGVSVLTEQIPEQILADGGQFELSPMYHSLALEDVLDLINIADTYAAAAPPGVSRAREQWRRLIPGMCRWLDTMCHPDGEISFFNDAAIGIAPSPDGLSAYATRLGLTGAQADSSPLIHLEASGYIRLTRGPIVAILDVARVGPDHLPAHAHADTLSFELSAFGQRVFVNSGTSVYGVGIERLRQRGTAANNTVLVDGVDSSEVWSGFRVARRAYPIDLRVEMGQTPSIRCAHNGYGRLPGRPRHARTWRLTREALVIQDVVEGRFKTAEARFHLHPFVMVDAIDGQVTRLRLSSGQSLSLEVDRGVVERVAASWHPEFGSSFPTSCLVVRFGAAELSTTIRWGVV